MHLKHNISLATLIVIISLIYYTKADDYKIGIGRADCTGPAAGITFMGYAKMTQKGCGVHLRQFSRAFIIDDGKKRVCYVTIDTCMVNVGLKREVIKKLQEKYNDTYDYNNVIMSGTHTHGTPGGFMEHLMYDIPDLGFCRETFNDLVTGIFNSIVRAHESVTDGKIYISKTTLLNANINRSPASYLYNPKEERDKYEYNVDKDLVQMRFQNKEGKDIGAIHWFAVHPTSMNNSNCLITSDNVGYASILLESQMNPNNLPGSGEFIGAFASTNLGDVSPNLQGPHCIDTGEECEMITSTCGGRAQNCIAFGPGEDMYDSTQIIAKRIFSKSMELWKNLGVEVSGPINFIHQFVDMPTQKVTIKSADGSDVEVSGCRPSMGYSFAAGTTDGPGDFDFTQATLTPNPFWNAVRDLVFPPTEADIQCQHPKPILINTGSIKFPYDWQPEIVATQIFRIGNVVFIAVPGEFTTMSGRRLRNAVKEVIEKECKASDVQPIITGLSNVYTSYIATPEEYQLQRYEGASTIFGPHTLDIYLEQYKKLAKAICLGEEAEKGPTPPDFSDKLLSLILPVIFDNPGNYTFGQCVDGPKESYKRGETVKAVFVSGHPRNSAMQGRTFLEVQRKGDDGKFVTVANDAVWETKFQWQKISLLGESRATIEWTIGENALPGIYKIVHHGYQKQIIVLPYSGETKEFTVE